MIRNIQWALSIVAIAFSGAAVWVAWDIGSLHRGNVAITLLIASNVALWLVIAYNIRRKAQG